MSEVTSAPDMPQLAGIEHRYVDLPGLRMHVAEAGAGDPVLLLHGFPQNWWEWRDIIPTLAERYRVICPDLRAAGWTEAPRGGYERDPLIADVLALLDVLGLDRVRLVCHDWSAIVGFALCLQRPERVESYVALSVPHPYIVFSPGMLAVWRLWFQFAIATPGLGPRLLSGGRQRLARYLFAHNSNDPGVWTEEDLEVFLSSLRDPDRARAGSAIYRRLILPEAMNILRGGYRNDRLHTPTLLLVGADDRGVRPEMLGGYEGHADHLELDFIEGAAHFIVDEKPRAVLDRLLAFWS